MTQISDAESRIMDALWSREPLTAEEIVEQVGAANGWAPGTVKTLITRLLRKKAIAGSREGEAYRYRTLVPRSAYIQAESRGLLDRLFQGEVAPLVAHLAEHRQLSEKDIQEIKALIARIEGGSP
jgi:BlaI family transcriptional regulator, penicillinase repressor